MEKLNMLYFWAYVMKGVVTWLWAMPCHNLLVLLTLTLTRFLLIAYKENIANLPTKGGWWHLNLGGRAHSNGLNGINWMVSNTWFPCLIPFHSLHSRHYCEPSYPHQPPVLPTLQSLWHSRWRRSAVPRRGAGKVCSEAVVTRKYG